MKKQIIIIGGSLGILLLFSIITTLASPNRPIEIESVISESDETGDAILVEEDLDNQEPATYIVDVKGEIKYPGIYEVDDTYRVYDVVLLAGGMTDLAQSESLNFAQKVRDEMVIYVPNIHEELETHSYLDHQSHDEERKVAINEASMEELQTLPGIGSVKAQAIINYRTEMGKFETVDDLTKVSGIGDKTLENLRDLIEI